MAGDLTDAGDCSTRVIEMKGGKKLSGQAAQVVYEITVMKEYTKINNLSGTITFDSGIAAKIGDLGLMYSMAGIYVWMHTAEACPRTLVQLYKGMIRIFSNHTASLDGGLALMEDKVKEQEAGLELQHMFVLCSSLALRTTYPTLPSLHIRTRGWKWPAGDIWRRPSTPRGWSRR
jgi:hypothetical protein